MTIISRPFFRSSARFLIAAFALCAAHSASAHAVWLEVSAAKNVIMRFGEGDEYEKSPGLLDNFSLPVVVSSPKREVEKKEDHFLLKGSEATQPVVISTTYNKVRKKEAKEGVPASASLTIFYARWFVPGIAAEPAADFDIVPAKEGGKATVYFQGKPLAGAKVRLKPAGGETVKLEADAIGVVTFTATAPGSYTLQANNPEKKAGTHQDVAYDTISHNVSVTWTQS